MYEFKLLWTNHLARSIRFTATPGGKLDNGMASANKLGSDRVIVPVTIIGDQDGSGTERPGKPMRSMATP